MVMMLMLVVVVSFVVMAMLHSVFAVREAVSIVIWQIIQLRSKGFNKKRCNTVYVELRGAVHRPSGKFIMFKINIEFLCPLYTQSCKRMNILKYILY